VSRAHTSEKYKSSNLWVYILLDVKLLSTTGGAGMRAPLTWMTPMCIAIKRGCGAFRLGCRDAGADKVTVDVSTLSHHSTLFLSKRNPHTDFPPFFTRQSREITQLKVVADQYFITS
jgi:hypothetical protein